MATDIKKTSAFFSPLRIVLHLLSFRRLIWLMSWREIQGRYRGAILGFGLSFFQPIVMLCVYTFVFSVVFNARWGIQTEVNRTSFALILFLGLITFRLISEMMNTSAELVTRHANYVKKVMFPLEILPVVRLLSILMDVIVNLVVLGAAIIVFRQNIYWTAVLLPVIWLPMIFLSMCCGYFLATIGVFFRDLKTTAGIITTFLFFSSAIFFPMNRVPDAYQVFFVVNPVAVFVEFSRKIVFWGELPDIKSYLIWLFISVLLWMTGFSFFMKFKKAFADVM